MTFAADTTTISNPDLVAALLAADAAAVRTELPAARLLVPATTLADGQAVVRTGRTGAGETLLWALTDLEALAAWDRHPAEHAVVLEGSALAGLDAAPRAVIALGALDPAPRAVIALNPAGPGAFLVDALAMLMPIAANGGVAGTGLASELAEADPWPAMDLVDADARRPVRARASEAHDLGRRAASAGDLEAACAELERSIDACRRLGDRLHGAAASLELASAREKAGSVERALTLWERAAQTLAVLGEGDLAIGALLDAANVALSNGQAAEAERLSVRALELCAGAELAGRLVSLWGGLDGR